MDYRPWELDLVSKARYLYWLTEQEALMAIFVGMTLANLNHVLEKTRP